MATGILNETFEGAGYVDANWTENVSGASSIDEDADVADVGSPTNWGSQCLKIVKASGDPALTENDIGSEIDPFYSRLEIVITAESLNNYQSGRVAVFSNSTGNTVAFLWIEQDGSGVLTFRIGMYRDGSSATKYTQIGSISLDTIYRIEFKFDPTNEVWAWRIGGVDQPNDVDASDPITSEGTLLPGRANGVQKYSLGGFAGDPVYTAYYDLVAVDNTDWVGDPTPPAGDIVIFRRRIERY